MEDGSMNSPYKGFVVICLTFLIGYFIFGKLDTKTQEIVMFVAEVFISTFDILLLLSFFVGFIYIVIVKTGLAKPLHDICTNFTNRMSFS